LGDAGTSVDWLALSAIALCGHLIVTIETLGRGECERVDAFAQVLAQDDGRRPI
jgi:hypothetical protein